MIQRIQTVYLLLTFVLMSLFFFIPFAQFIGGSEEFQITAWGIKSLSGNGEYVVPAPYMGLLMALAALLPLAIVFLYKFRFLQLRLCLVELVLLVGVGIYVGFYGWGSKSVVGSFEVSTITISPIAALPLVGIILTILAFRGVLRDKNLIKSLNRIR